MDNAGPPRLVFHGAVIVLVALACGLPAVVEVSAGSARMWQAAHSALLVMGIWLLAEAAVVRLIILKRSELAVLTWSLVAAGYSLAFAAVVQAATGVRTFGPSSSAIHMSVFIANLIVVLGSVLAASLTLIGAKNAMTDARRRGSRPSESADVPPAAV